mgnify:CR=1 FL=1
MLHGGCVRTGGGGCAESAGGGDGSENEDRCAGFHLHRSRRAETAFDERQTVGYRLQRDSQQCGPSEHRRPDAGVCEND